MKILKKSVALIIIFTVVFTQSIFGEEANTASQFSDLNESHWAYEGIEKLVDAGIIAGYPDGTFKPEGNITRAELIKIVNLIYSYADKQETANLYDIRPEDWFYDHVLIAQKAGYIIGFEDGTFRPADDITREQLCKIIDTVNGLMELPFDETPTDEVSAWAVEYVERVLSNRIMSLEEDGSFRATEKATRAEACDALSKFLLPDEEDASSSQVVPSGGGGTSSGGETENSDEKDEVDETMSTVIKRLKNGVIPELTTDEQVEIVNDIILNMEKYQADNSYDYKSAAEEAYNKYKALSDEERSELKEKIQLKNSTGDLLDLKEFFFPEVDI